MASEENDDKETLPIPKQFICLSGCSQNEEVNPECEIIPEGIEDDPAIRFEECQNNATHESFIRVNDFNMEHLPQEYRTVEMMEEVFRRSVFTVRIKATYVSKERPQNFADSQRPYPYSDHRGEHLKRCGTGALFDVFYNRPIVGKPCPCPLCKKSSKPKMVFWWVLVRTATHLIFDRSEAEGAEFNCFYDEDTDLKDCKTMYGFDTFNMMPQSSLKVRNDVCDVLCVTHDHDIVARFNDILPSDQFLCPPKISSNYSPSKVIISHPHGGSKRISVCEVLSLTVPLVVGYAVGIPIDFKKDTIYRRSSKNEAGAATKSETKKEKDKESKATAALHIEYQDKILNSVESSKYALKTLLDIIKNYKYKIRVNVDQESDAITHKDLKDKDAYLQDFYFLFMRQQCLRFFVISSFLEHKKNSKKSTCKDLAEKAIKTVFRNYLGKDYEPTSIGQDKEKSETDDSCRLAKTQTSITSKCDDKERADCNTNLTSVGKLESFQLKNNADIGGVLLDRDGQLVLNKASRFQPWADLIRASEDDLKKYASNLKDGQFDKSGQPSTIVDLFQKIGESVKTRKNLSEDQLLKYFEDCIDLGREVCLEHLEAQERNIPENAAQDTASREHERPENKKDIKDDNDTDCQKRTNKEEVLPKSKDAKEDKCVDNDVKENKVKLEDKTMKERKEESESRCDKNGKEGEKIPEGTSFTLPIDAKYAFKVDSSSPGWIQFPEGTKINFRAETKNTTVDSSSFEFKHPFTEPEQSYLMYDTTTCNGSSGAHVHSNILGRYVGTYFPHFGKLGGSCRSGIRDNFVPIYSLVYLFSSRELQEDLDREEKPTNLLLALLSRLKTVLRKTDGEMEKNV